MGRRSRQVRTNRRLAALLDIRLDRGLNPEEVKEYLRLTGQESVSETWTKAWRDERRVKTAAVIASTEVTNSASYPLTESAGFEPVVGIRREDPQS